ncbi:MAG: ATP synthase F1 subunit delta [Bacteroidales bacterium]|nr:ATP synthase F1 subunit delta [Bacteroidales bacterium]
MLGSIIAERYAKALFDLALETGKLEEVRNDMALMLEVIQISKEFKHLLASPIFRPDKKIGVMDSIFKDKIETLTKKFYHLIVQKRREKYLHNVVRQFIEKYKDYHNIVTLELRSVVPVHDDLQKKIIEIIEQREQVQVELVEIQDECLIGGFIITSKDQRYDASLKSAIKKLKREFEENLYIREF